MLFRVPILPFLSLAVCPFFAWIIILFGRTLATRILSPYGTAETRFIDLQAHNGLLFSNEEYRLVYGPSFSARTFIIVDQPIPIVAIITGVTTPTHHPAITIAPPRTECIDAHAIAEVEAMTATGTDEEPHDIEEDEVSDDAFSSTSVSTPASTLAPTPSLTPSNGSQSTQRRCPPSPPPALPPPPPLQDLGPELELVIEPVDDIEAELAERKRRRNEILAKYSSHQRTPQPQTPSVPTESPSTRAPTPVGNGDGDATAAEDFELSIAESPKLNTDYFGAADFDESADRREDATPILLHRTQDAMDVGKDEFEEIEEVFDDKDVDDMLAFDDDEKLKKKVVKKVKKIKPANILPDGGVGLDAADDPEGYYTPTLGETLGGKYHVFSIISKGMFAVVVKARVVVAEDGTLLPDTAPKPQVAIQIIRSQRLWYKSGQREAALLAVLNAASPGFATVERMWCGWFIRG
ncbi:hypothetical protein DL96DRAFT_1688773 [Flagelloscypha sp. PMI_526]|nr:hypothetical protein DL96DRAFT_1688773 [Flagelloscypha sp. PMI_526]